MSLSPRHPPQPARFDRGARLLIAFVLLYVLVAVVQLIYRYTLPTEGWSANNDGANALVWAYDANLIGTPSALRSGDVIQAVDGQPVQVTNFRDFVKPPAGWQVGKTVVISVERNGQTVDVPVLVTHWTPGAVWRWDTGDPAQVASILGALFVFILVWLIFLRRPELPSARILLFIGCGGIALVLSGMLPDGLSVLFNRYAFLLSNFFGFDAWIALPGPAVLAFTLSFPQPKQVIRRHPWLGLIPFAFGLVEFAGFYTLNINALDLVSTYSPAILFGASILSLIHSGFTQRDPTSRAQLRWIIWGFTVGLTLSLVYPSSYDPKNPVDVILGLISNLGGVVIGVCLGIAVLRYHLFEIDVIIRKTLIYTTLTGLLALIYFGSVILLDNLAGALSGQQHSPLVLVVSTLAIAALFNPLRRQIQMMIDRRLYRPRYDAGKALESFGRSIRDEVDLDAMTQALLKAVQDSVQPESSSLWLSTTKPNQGWLQTPAEAKPLADKVSGKS